MATKWNEISIADPISGHVEIFSTIKEAKTFARKQDYSPVYINLYDEDGIVDDIEITNKNI